MGTFTSKCRVTVSVCTGLAAGQRMCEENIESQLILQLEHCYGLTSLGRTTSGPIFPILPYMFEIALYFPQFALYAPYFQKCHQIDGLNT